MARRARSPRSLLGPAGRCRVRVAMGERYKPTGRFVNGDALSRAPDRAARGTGRLAVVSVSGELFERAQRVIPGGVNSPVRAFRAVGGTPRFMVRAHGPYLIDADGRDYVDLVASWGPMILGHAHPAVVAATHAAAADGLSFGTPTAGEVELAEEIIGRVGPVEQVRLVNSGTEATMSAIRLARGVTGRHRVVKF